MVQRSYKPAKLDGRKVEFKVTDGLVFARVPSVSRQFIGVGTSKSKALADAKSSMKHIKVNRRGKPIRRKK